MTPDDLRSNYDRVRAVLSSARGASSRPITLIAVSKMQSADAVAALYALGHRDFGENYVQELVAKARDLESRGCRGIRWHFIGHLQSNKAKQLVEAASSVHAIDSESTARELARRWRASGRMDALPVFIEVNIDAEATKSGVSTASAPEIARKIDAIEGLELRGLMCVPAPGSHGAFARLRELELKCRPSTRGDLSMGMSSDFEEAIREGATHVRVGTSLFGARA